MSRRRLSVGCALETSSSPCAERFQLIVAVFCTERPRGMAEKEGQKAQDEQTQLLRLQKEASCQHQELATSHFSGARTTSETPTRCCRLWFSQCLGRACTSAFLTPRTPINSRGNRTASQDDAVNRQTTSKLWLSLIPAHGQTTHHDCACAPPYRSTIVTLPYSTSTPRDILAHP